jgi:hypothetical protein
MPWAALAVGALVPMGRVLADPLHVVPGTGLSDMYKHVWSYWHALALPWGDWPHTPFLNAPGGGILLDLLFLPALLLAPVTALLGPAGAANLFIWLNVWATGAATFALARALAPVEPGSTPWGALGAGLAAQTAPYLLGYPLTSGVHERLMVWVFPLVALAVWRCRADDAEVAARGRAGSRAVWAAIATGGFFVAGLGCQAYALYGAVMLLLGVPLWLGPWGRVGVHARRLAPLAVGVVLAGLAAWAHTRWLTEDTWALVPRPDVTVPVFGPDAPGGAPLAVATFATLLDPLAVHATRVRISGDELHELVYLGWVPLLAALVGAVRAQGPTRWFVRGLAALGLGMAVLAVGPTFQAFGVRFLEPVSLAVSWVVPFYGTYAPVWQQAALFAPLVAPALAVAVGLAGPRRLFVVSAVLLAATIAERAWVLPVPVIVTATALEVPAPYLSVGEGPLVDIPRVIGRTPLAPGLYFLAQTAHQQPMAATINPGNSVFDAYPPVLRGIAHDWTVAADCLRRGGLRWVVVHRGWLDDAALAARTTAGLTAAAGPPVADDGDVVLYDLGVPVATAPLLPPPTTQAHELLARGWIGRPAATLGAAHFGKECPVDRR